MDKTIISVEISAELKESLRIEAFNQKITISALIRQILERELLNKSNIKGEELNNGRSKE